ncbi:MAG: pyruvate kinase [Nitrospirae bacterium]|nr:MAG: pyruvate kinase [Nitrospirota bacterium]
MRRAKIICTIGPASRSPETLERLIRHGMDVARLNMSHGTYAEHHEVVRNVRRLAKESGRAVAIMLDLQGPRIRVGDLPQPLTLESGQTVRLVAAHTSGDLAEKSVAGEPVIPIDYESLTQSLRPGARVMMDDGLIEMVADRVEQDSVICTVITGGQLKARKGVNFPGTRLNLPSLTDKDWRDVQFGLDHEVDYIALSFVRSAEDIRALKLVIADQSSSVPIIAKVERPEAIERLDEILASANGVMIARGDLAIEMSPEDVPILQKQIIRAANRHRRIVITATQMLESMTTNPTPTRAEATDVANAIFDGTDAVMLSAETSIGRYPIDALQVMDRIIRRAEGADRVREPETRLDSGGARSIPEAVCTAAVTAADTIRAKAILAMTERGATAQLVAALRPAVPIIALTPFEQVRRRLAMIWGVVPYILSPIANTDTRIAAGVELAKAAEGIRAGDDLVVLTGVQVQQPGGTNLMKIHHVE